jgi:hypothetical protein
VPVVKCRVADPRDAHCGRPTDERLDVHARALILDQLERDGEDLGAVLVRPDLDRAELHVIVARGLVLGDDLALGRSVVNRRPRYRIAAGGLNDGCGIAHATEGRQRLEQAAAPPGWHQVAAGGAVALLTRLLVARDAGAQHRHLLVGETALANDQEIAERRVVAIGAFALFLGHAGASAVLDLRLLLLELLIAVDLGLPLVTLDLRVDAVDLAIQRIDLVLDFLGELVTGVGVEKIAGLARLVGALVPKRLDVHGVCSKKKPRERRGWSGARGRRRWGVGRQAAVRS